MEKILVGDKVMLKQTTPEEISPGGLYLGKNDRVDNVYEVVAVGPGIPDGRGGVRAMTARVGDLVAVPNRPIGQQVTVEDEVYIICKEHELPVILRKAEDD